MRGKLLLCFPIYCVKNSIDANHIMTMHDAVKVLHVETVCWKET